MNFNFIQQDFQLPPHVFAPVYTWVWNDIITKDEIDRQLDEMVRCNIKTTYILPEPRRFRPTGMKTYLEPEYLSDEFFELVRYTAEAAKKRGMLLWLYDEGGWPSGNACGQVVKNNPQFAQKLFSQEKIILAAGATLPAEGMIAAFTENYQRVDLPFTAREDTALLVYKIVRGPRTDLLDCAATDEFIRITHDRYRQYAGEFFGSGITMAFTDEPSIAYPAYFEGAEKYYDFLPALFDEHAMGEAGTLQRIAYCDEYSRIAEINYYGKLQKWCRQNGILSGGHLNGEDNFAAYRTHGGHLMRHLRKMDVPGVDAIWRQIFPSENSVKNENKFFPRLASSAANQTGAVYAASESFAVYGAGVTYGQMRYGLNFQAVRGINLFNFMVISYGNRGMMSSHERPSFQPELPGSGDKAGFNEYVARLSYIAALGKSCVKSALYYPMRDVWAGGEACRTAISSFERMGREMERMQGAFDIVDDDFLAQCTVCDKKISNGYAEYDTVYIPDCTFMPPEIRAKLLSFERSGGRIFRNIAITMPLVKLNPVDKNLRSAKRITEDRDIVYVIYNEGLERAVCTVTFEEDILLYELDLVSGEIYKAPNPYSLALECGEEKIFLFTEKALAVSERMQDGMEIPFKFSFTARRIRELQMTEDGGLLSAAIEEASRPVEAGDWRSFFDGYFSGDVLYESSFPSFDYDVILDFGEVKYTCELFIDGQSFGVRYMAPYRYRIPQGIGGKLALRVSNTAANFYTNADTFAKFGKEVRGSYHDRTVLFEADSVESGLLGQVRILQIQ